MKSTNFALCTLALFGAFAVSIPAYSQPGAQTDKTSTNAMVVERGRFLFFDTRQPAGQESYEITREGRTVVLRSRLEMEIEDEKVSLAATLIMRPDLTPERFEIKGKKPSRSEIDSKVEVRGRAATVTEKGRTSRTTVPARYFTAGGYAPLAIEMMLLRYWTSNRVKGPLKVLPYGEVAIESSVVPLTVKTALSRTRS